MESGDGETPPPFKILWDFGVVCLNAPDYQRMPVAELEQMAGISLLPGVSNSIKAIAMALPESHPYARKGR